jgi:hypothetical protein
VASASRQWLVRHVDGPANAVSARREFSGPVCRIGTELIGRPASRSWRRAVDRNVPFSPVEDVEFAEIVRECVVENCVFGVHPFAVHDVTAADSGEQVVLHGRCPCFEGAELAFAWSAGEVVAAALQAQGAVVAEADGGVRPVEFFLDHGELAADLVERDGVHVLVAWLQPGRFQVVGAGVLA